MSRPAEALARYRIHRFLVLLLGNALADLWSSRHFATSLPTGDVLPPVQRTIRPFSAKHKQESRAVAGKPLDAAVNFDQYRVCRYLLVSCDTLNGRM